MSPLKSPDGSAKPDVRIYILCHTDERFSAAREIYKPWYWAVPIFMKYQDCTFENAFWQELLEIKDEWEGCEMVGTLSFTAYKKADIDAIDGIIRDRNYWKYGYYNFNERATRITNDHPNLLQIITDVMNVIGLPVPTVSHWNYWMCTPDKMVRFIEWYETKLKPAVLAHPLAMTNAYYKSPTLSSSECLTKFGVPYYPHVPFVIERLNKAFFSNKKDILASNTPRVVVFSVNLGNYDKRIRSHVSQTYPYDNVFYTDSDDLDISDARNYYEASRKWRLSAHMLNKTKEYDIAIYLDSNVYITEPTFIQTLVDHHSAHNWDMLMSPHEARNTNTEEARECIKSKTRYSTESLVKYLDTPSYNRLCWCGFNARWLTSPNSKNCSKLMDHWWGMIKADPYGIVNDQIEWPAALEYADKHFPIVFSHKWQKEYLQKNSFHIEFTNRRRLVTRRTKLPLVNGVTVDTVVIYILCYSDTEFANAQYDFRSFYWAQPILVSSMEASVLEREEPTWSNCQYVGFVEYTQFNKIQLYDIHIYITTRLVAEDIQYYYTHKTFMNRMLIECGGAVNPFWLCSVPRFRKIVELLKKDVSQYDEQKGGANQDEQKVGGCEHIQE